MAGWRFAFLSVAALSYLIGGLTLWLGTEPRKIRAAGSSAAKETIKVGDIAGHMATVMRVPTFGIIVAQVTISIDCTLTHLLVSKQT